ncbi:SCO3242 family prenyltransferase [Actinoplanes sp. NPDC051494]|uniref:SCO3242 family prenyltransferase n=1 Tax=Actinoplanes sp. NPDC051494 TaxID=3363907 RepID=UPI00379D8EDA
MKNPLRTLTELVRAPAALSVPGDVLAGAAAAGVLGRRSAGLASASVLLYWAGMAANDWADRDLDATERPERPIPSGRISPTAALGVAAGLTAAGLAVAGRTGGGRALSVAVPLAAAVWAYDLRLKNTAAGPAGMALCRALDVLLGATPGHPVRAVPTAAAIAVHTYTVTALSRHEVSGSPSAALPSATLATTAALTAVVAATRPARPGGNAERAGNPERVGDPERSGSAVRSGNAERTVVLAGGRGRDAVTAILVGEYVRGYGPAQARLFADPGAGRVRASVGAGITGLPALQGALISRSGRPLVGLALAMAAPLARRLARTVSPT